MPGVIIEWSGFALAVLGSTLGVHNTLQNRRRDKELLKVKPRFAYQIRADATREEAERDQIRANGTREEAGRVNIEIINMSFFPVTINRVGFYAGRKDWLMLVPPVDIQGQPLEWPYCLERGQSVNMFPGPDLQDNKSFAKIRGVFAGTTTGRLFKTTSGELRQFVTDTQRRKQDCR